METSDILSLLYWLNAAHPNMDTKTHSKILVSVIIPALNEEKTIANVVRTARSHPSVGEVIVVDDGSKDRTALCARDAGALVISQEINTGKGNALDIGTRSARYDFLVFLDADLRGLTRHMLTELIRPVVSGSCGMCVALHDRRYYWLNSFFKYVPMLAGQRALKKKIWYSIPAKHRKKFQTEIALNYYTSRNNEKTQYVLMRGLKHTIKEHKHGYIRGFFERVIMLRDLLWITFQLYGLERISSSFGRLKEFAFGEAENKS